MPKRRGGGEGRLFRGRVEKFNRRMRSDASVMHRSEGFVRGQFALCMKEEGGREGERKRRGDSLARSTMSLSSSNYRAFISWKTSPLLSLSLSLSSIVIDGLSCPLYGVFKKKKKKSKDRLVSPLDREKETTPLIIVNPHSGQINRNANLFFQLFFQFNQSGVEKGDRDDYLSLLWWTRDEDA